MKNEILLIEFHLFKAFNANGVFKYAITFIVTK